MTLRTVSIHYRRLPARDVVFRQLLLEETADWTVTFMEAAELSKPVVARGEIVLEPGAPVVWFTYPGRWYDIGRFHRADGGFTGYYANLLTPVRMDGDRWETTDLCLDVWLGADGRVELLDEDELAEAVRERLLEPRTEARVREEAASIVAAARDGRWPPAPVAEWDLRRASALAARRPT